MQQANDRAALGVITWKARGAPKEDGDARQNFFSCVRLLFRCGRNDRGLLGRDDGEPRRRRGERRERQRGNDEQHDVEHDGGEQQQQLDDGRVHDGDVDRSGR
ncbi:hypothetical protein BE04_10625 [Sorangium cellulosum]|uniref:Uncharacterized protein n=1 Tax=Sorangium cellulosum TaxID=56 RepID=A0A150P9I5_SORCE|nr:hypothetical protein BE04_10625 [Sorangium cellulosum]